MTNDRNDTFPFERVLSLRPLIDFWQEVAADASSPRAALGRTILAMLDETPDLREPITDLAPLERHIELLDLMMTAVFPMALWEQTHAAAFVPFDLVSFYATPAFARLKLLEHLQDDLLINGQPFDPGEMNHMKTMLAYHHILNRFYGIDSCIDFPLIVTTTDEQTGLKRHFKISTDTRFIDIETRAPLKTLSEEQIQRLLADPMNQDLWQEWLPPEQFAFHGFTILTAVDVTVQQILSLLKDDLLQREALTSVDRIDTLQTRLRMLLRAPQLQVGLIGFLRDNGEAITGARAVGRSLLMSEDTLPACEDQCHSYYVQALKMRQPLIVTDLQTCEVCTGFEQHLRQQHLRNLVIAPLWYEDQLLGLLELASPRPGAVNAANAVVLDEVITLLATAMKRSLEEQEDRIQALIKKHYTAIHPTVEWRFRKAALTYMQRQETGEHAELEPIVFHNVYPLYGLSDIRDSSTIRNAAIQADLIEQLGMALGIIIEASTHRPLPVLDELGYRLGKYIDELVSGLHSGDETLIFNFLRDDVESLFDQLATMHERVRERIEAYRTALDPGLGILYRQRKDFEESVTLINETISAYLDRREEQAQQMFPHYFEKYKTDGVDYNIYVGASLVEQQPFDRLYLRNLRLWQLMTMCGVVWELNRLHPKLPIPLETAHLILVQDVPLSIRFRQDEKRFDVDGAYNIRYEIVKKRIDKARIRGRDERLTQPGKIAIVYSQPREAEEYLRYIEYLQASGYLKDPVEHLELEDLQGVYGLHALRVTVADGEPEAEVLYAVPAELTTPFEATGGDGAAHEPA
ncbi:MAG: hypothetical protein KatS3mg043_0684 [Rhodothermaceae bacterium]|nr:MAG: hypothetical protein KatS3mg043_0684 [Rhodothermaceae bacterium]